MRALCRWCNLPVFESAHPKCVAAYERLQKQFAECVVKVRKGRKSK